MDRAIRITAGSVSAEAWLNDSQTARATSATGAGTRVTIERQ
jgi:hypothetical protein